MHERTLMAQIVKLAEAKLRDEPDARPIAVRLKVNALSHLYDLDASWLGLAFAQAACGTVLEGTTLEVIRVPLEARCRTCGTVCEWTGGQTSCPPRCPACGAETVMPEETPEVVLHEIVLAE